MALTRAEIAQAHEEMVEIATGYLNPVLHLPAETFTISEVAESGEYIDITACRPIGDISLDAADFVLVISDPFLDPAMPGTQSSFGREYLLNTTTASRRLFKTTDIGNTSIRQLFYEDTLSYLGVPIHLANLYRHIGRGLLNSDELMNDLELASVTMQGKDVLSTN